MSADLLFDDLLLPAMRPPHQPPLPPTSTASFGLPSHLFPQPPAAPTHSHHHHHVGGGGATSVAAPTNSGFPEFPFDLFAAAALPQPPPPPPPHSLSATASRSLPPLTTAALDFGATPSSLLPPTPAGVPSSQYPSFAPTSTASISAPVAPVGHTSVLPVSVALSSSTTTTRRRKSPSAAASSMGASSSSTPGSSGSAIDKDKLEERRRKNRLSSAKCYYNRKKQIERVEKTLTTEKRRAITLYARELELRNENARLKKELVLRNIRIPSSFLTSTRTEPFARPPVV